MTILEAWILFWGCLGTERSRQLLSHNVKVDSQNQVVLPRLSLIPGAPGTLGL